MGSILDDIESRPGSTISVLRTVIGLYLRRLDGSISIANLVGLMEDLGVADSLTRTAVVRLKKKGMLIAERKPVIGYRLNPDALPMLASGDRRIFTIRSMAEGDPWCLISFSIPEQLRDRRHQLRRRLHWIGCGTVSQALWICPDYLAQEVEDILEDVGVRSFATTFRAEQPRVAGQLTDAVASWWDLDALREAHLEFLDAVDGLVSNRPLTPREAFANYVMLIDRWRVIPYIDPGLPASLLPADWPGSRSIDLFREKSALLADPAWEHVSKTVGPGHPAINPADGKARGGTVMPCR
ncbi:MAG: PaaX family transcriptional regulator C-terminal domain-containing protein [Pseudolysinimonas sp.]